MRPDPWFERSLKVIDPCLEMRWYPDQHRWWIVRRECGESWIVPVETYQQTQRFLEGIRLSDARQEHQWWARREKMRRDDDERAKRTLESIATNAADRTSEVLQGSIPGSHRLRDVAPHVGRNREFSREIARENNYEYRE